MRDIESGLELVAHDRTHVRDVKRWAGLSSWFLMPNKKRGMRLSEQVSVWSKRSVVEFRFGMYDVLQADT